ncbi:unnamed protein product [Arctia plantaginis]|uniref:Uncharacterized protein n=1 Tax=Arctia plantaginis TaxID=874455 RepID=A0A8S1BFQ6_ARCPL|nr:unnamed protein product [Arctia plantaginis]
MQLGSRRKTRFRTKHSVECVRSPATAPRCKQRARLNNTRTHRYDTYHAHTCAVATARAFWLATKIDITSTPTNHRATLSRYNGL